MNVTGTGTEVKITGSLAFGTVTSATKQLSVTVTNEGTTTLTLQLCSDNYRNWSCRQYNIVPFSGLTQHLLEWVADAHYGPALHDYRAVQSASR